MIPSPPALRTLLVIAALALLVAVPALAAKDRKASDGFELRSRLLSQDPEIREALFAVRRDPADAEAWNLLGRRLADRGAYEDSVDAFSRAVRLEPDNEVFRNNVGASLLKMGRLRRALASFEKAREIEPFNAMTWYNLGVAQDRLGRYDKALRAYEAAFQLDPDLADPAKNPGVVNNEHLMAIRLRVYRQTAGSNPALFGGDSAPEEEAP